MEIGKTFIMEVYFFNEYSHNFIFYLCFGLIIIACTIDFLRGS